MRGTSRLDFQKGIGKYIEPFVGSGAVFFELEPSSAILSDANSALVSTYKAVRSNPDEVYAGLVALQYSHSKDNYYIIRASEPSEPVQAAVRFIYLNRTCWNGLYRVNRRNEFNVPIGTKNTVLFPTDDFRLIASTLKRAEIIQGDFSKSIERGQKGDLIYADPPYTVRHNANGFLKYNETVFSWADQIRLRDCLYAARDRGCHIAVSNADHPSVRQLYKDFGPMTSISRASVIAGSANCRGPTSELLVINYA